MIDLSLFEGHTPAPWWWGEWCETLFGIPPHHDGDYEYHDDTQTIFVMNTNKTPICPSFYQWENGQDLHMKGEERWGVVSRKAWPEESLRNNALRSEDAMLIAYAPKLLAEVKQLREELNSAYDTIQEYEEVIEPEHFNKIERLEKALKNDGKYNAVVSATGNAGGGSIMVNVTFDDGEKYYGILDKEMNE